MNRQRLFSILLFCSMLGSVSLIAQSMRDAQVLEYVKDGIRQGKEQKQLASELARKGVTKEQAMRVKQLYEQENNMSVSHAIGTELNASRLREETKENTSDMLEDHPDREELARGNQVFGRNIFNTRNLTFEPSVNLATPFINGKTNCSLFSKHFAQDFVLLTQNKMYILLFPIICFSDFVLSLLLLS